MSRCTFLRVNSSHRPCVPLKRFPLIVTSLAIHGQLGIAYHERIPILSYAILRVEKTTLIGPQVRTLHGAKLLSAVLLRIRLDKCSIGNFVIIIIILGSTFRSLVYRRQTKWRESRQRRLLWLPSS